MSAKLSDPARYLPQLDSVRALAITAVVVYHFTHMAIGDDRLGILGGLGVELFFVLSGFLITGILLRARYGAEANAFDKRGVLKRFYIRRFLRIFPLYYFAIVIAIGFNLPGVPPAREVLGWLVTYTVNIAACLHGAGSLAAFGHFWSLSVEEQFYLFWPWFVLFAPRKMLFPGVITMIALGPLYRWFGFGAGFGPEALYHFTLSCLDSLGIGALLAMIHRSAINKEKFERILKGVALPVGLVASLALLLNNRWELGIPGVLAVTCYAPAHALVFAWLIHYASKGFTGRVGALLELTPVTYLGKISYGVYVYHPFIGYSMNYLLFSVAGAGSRTIAFLSPVLCIPIVLLVAAKSWEWLEKPINDYKSRFAEESVLQKS
jgi:peptidoglycan/LPS O-acetylase OafA/YrhL